MAAASKKVKHLADFHYPHFAKWDKKRTNVKFNMANIHYSMANALRRVMMAEVPTVAFRDKPHAASTINIKINHTPHNNEQLAHRIALVPINVAHPDKFKADDYLFMIDVSNDSSNVRYITSGDIRIKHIPTGKMLEERDTRRFFAADPITGDYSIITVLKSRNYVKIPHNPELASMIPKDKDEEVNRLYVEMKATIGDCCNGTDNSHYSPVCVSCYTNMVDPKLAEEGFATYLVAQKHLAEVNKTTPYSDEFLRKRFEVNERYRFYYKDERGEPNLFTYEIESVGVIPPLIVFMRAIDVLKEKIMNFLNNLLSKNQEIIETKPSTNVRGYEIFVNNEDDTLGNIIQCHLGRMYADYSQPEEKRLLGSIGYSRIHPCKRRIRFLVASDKFASLDEIAAKVFKPGCMEIIHLLDTIQKELLDSAPFVEEARSISDSV
jgi:DNA-directed RNA polymerase subunit L